MRTFYSATDLIAGESQLRYNRSKFLLFHSSFLLAQAEMYTVSHPTKRARPVSQSYEWNSNLNHLVFSFLHTTEYQNFILLSTYFRALTEAKY